MKLRNTGEKRTGPRAIVGAFRIHSRFKIKAGKPGKLTLWKEVAKPGRYQDMYGNWVEFVAYSFKGVKAPEGVVSLPDLARDTAKLMGQGFRVCGYSEHETNDSRNVLGIWDSFEFNGKTLEGVVTALNQSAYDLMKSLDTSMVVEEGVSVNGLILGPVITRCDVVGQGAIVGTKPFRSFSFSGVSMAPRFVKEKAMKRSLVLVALSHALGIVGLQETAPEALEGAILEATGLEGKPEDEIVQTLAGAFESAIEQSEAAEAVQGELETPEEMAQEIEALRTEKVEAAFAEVPDVAEEDKTAMLARFQRVKKSAGFKLAFESLSAELKARKLASLHRPSQGIRQTPEGSGPTRIERKDLLKLAKADKSKGKTKGLLGEHFAKMGYKARPKS